MPTAMPRMPSSAGLYDSRHADSARSSTAASTCPLSVSGGRSITLVASSMQGPQCHGPTHAAAPSDGGRGRGRCRAPAG